MEAARREAMHLGGEDALRDIQIGKGSSWRPLCDHVVHENGDGRGVPGIDCMSAPMPMVFGVGDAHVRSRGSVDRVERLAIAGVQRVLTATAAKDVSAAPPGVERVIASTATERVASGAAAENVVPS